MSDIRVRFAPSPTGLVHIGSLRGALFTWLFARKHQGAAVLRIEDTDQSRLVAGAVENLLDVFEWAGLDFDEGPRKSQPEADSRGAASGDLSIEEVGEYGPYAQSARLEIYKKYADQLLESGHAYWCDCSPERLDTVRKQMQARKEAPMYDKKCRDRGLTEEQGKVLRLRIPEGVTHFDDMIKGRVEVDNAQIDDQVLLKSDGFPTYHLAVVVDDYLMKISHVIRGDEWLISTPKHVLLYQALGWELPVFAHLPLILAPDKSKLSKRHGSVSVEEFQEEGYLPDALINFVALLGWHPEGDLEIMSREELVEKFSMERVQKSAAIFDREKLGWMNAEYIKKLSVDELYELSKPHLERKGSLVSARDDRKDDQDDINKDEEYLKKVLTLEQTRIQKLSEVGEEVGFFFEDVIVVDPTLIVWKKSDDATTREVLEKLHGFLSSYDGEWEVDALEPTIKQFIADNEYDNGTVLWPMRYSLTGQKKSPGPFECAWVLGKEKTLSRLQMAQSLL